MILYAKDCIVAGVLYAAAVCVEGESLVLRLQKLTPVEGVDVDGNALPPIAEETVRPIANVAQGAAVVDQIGEGIIPL